LNATQAATLGGLALGALLTGWLLHSQDNYSATTDLSPHGPDIFIRGMQLEVMDESGSLQYRLQADTMDHYPGDDRIALTGPVMEVFSGKQPVWHIESQTSELDDKADTVHLLGEVVIRRHETRDGRELVVHTRDLVVTPRSRTAETRERAVIESGQYTIEGVGMHADFTSHRLRLDSRVRGRFDAAG
jgi:lipopolysaccharide export system protein LptC